MLPYVRLERDECLNIKKEILSIEIGLLNLTKRMDSYKKKRKTELIRKVSLKKSIKSAGSKLNLLISELPPIESEPKIIETTKDINKRKSIESELEEIKAKLARL